MRCRITDGMMRRMRAASRASLANNNKGFHDLEVYVSHLYTPLFANKHVTDSEHE